jgi:hypothetical protein
MMKPPRPSPPPSPPPPEFDVDLELADNKACEEAAQAATISVFDVATAEETCLCRVEEMGKRQRAKQLQRRRRANELEQRALVVGSNSPSSRSSCGG